MGPSSEISWLQVGHIAGICLVGSVLCGAATVATAAAAMKVTTVLVGERAAGELRLRRCDISPELPSAVALSPLVRARLLAAP